MPKYTSFSNPDGSLDKCSDCNLSEWFEILGITSDGYLLYKCVNCGHKYYGDAMDLAGLSYHGVSYFNERDPLQ